MRLDLSEKPKLPESFEEETWSKLKLCINAVHSQEHVGQSFEELYKVLSRGGERGGRMLRLCSRASLPSTSCS